MDQLTLLTFKKKKIHNGHDSMQSTVIISFF